MPCEAMALFNKFLLLFVFHWDERWVLSTETLLSTDHSSASELDPPLLLPWHRLRALCCSGLIATCDHVTVVWCCFSSYIFWVSLRWALSAEYWVLIIHGCCFFSLHLFCVSLRWALGADRWSMIIQWFYLFIRNFKALKFCSWIPPCCSYDSAFAPFAVQV
jgi:hypothetical protein